ncbi:GNAT family N-acetyltransferase [Mucilaginibacter sp. S1162]|uniref:GNAT family N-acetyltransferase n=1 Tax=Mucilaginibacter humi TaxID=2732510 RepID=A0ABX1W3U2_9SPHI|nr:GNAT family N-acetyltransferase [Mucilaginibacter humi]NNU34780.1 GNAT family N-acetyltransferase [Mucilaginibacter humi]
MISIRKAIDTDLPQLAAIRGSDPLSVANWINRIAAYINGTHHPQKALAGRVVFVAVFDEQVVGFIAGHLTRRFECHGELQWINVINEQQHKGIAGMLLKKLASWFLSYDAKQICVNCEPDNIVALTFYKKHGAETLNNHWLVWKNIGMVNPDYRKN